MTWSWGFEGSNHTCGRSTWLGLGTCNGVIDVDDIAAGLSVYTCQRCGKKTTYRGEGMTVSYDEDES